MPHVHHPPRPDSLIQRRLTQHSAGAIDAEVQQRGVVEVLFLVHPTKEKHTLPSIVQLHRTRTGGKAMAGPHTTATALSYLPTPSHPLHLRLLIPLTPPSQAVPVRGAVALRAERGGGGRRRRWGRVGGNVVEEREAVGAAQQKQGGGGRGGRGEESSGQRGELLFGLFNGLFGGRCRGKGGRRGLKRQRKSEEGVSASSRRLAFEAPLSAACSGQRQRERGGLVSGSMGRDERTAVHAVVQGIS